MRDRHRAYETATAVFLLLLALVLRAWNVDSMPLFHDELSALSRAEFDDFSSLIAHGVVPDAHPAFAQVLLWIWSPFVDGSNGLLRLPFLLMGWGAVVVIWRLVDLASDRFRANLTAAVLAAGQLFILNSDFARPYAPGMLFVALYALAWYRWVVERRRTTMAFVGMALWMALAAYTHYFSLLTVTAIWISGWFYVRRLKPLHYVANAGLAFLLFSPHLGIFFTQLGYGGIGGPGGWLRPPESADVVDWFAEVFNFNIFLSCVAVVSWVFGIVKYVAVGYSRDKLSVVLWFWFAITIATGLVYSYAVNPVMHIMTLVFAFPFVVAAAAWPWKTDDLRLKVGVPLLVAAITSYALIFERDHYEAVAHQPFDFAADALSDRPDAFHAIAVNPAYLEYTFERRDETAKSADVNFYVDSASMQTRVNALAAFEGSGYVSDGRHPALDAFALRKYPHVEERVEGYTFTGWVFTEGVDNQSEYLAPLALRTEPHRGDDEFLNILKTSVDTIELNFAHELRTVVDFTSTPPANLHVVYHLRRGEENFHWSSVKPAGGAEMGGRFTMVHNLLLWDVFSRREAMAGVEVSIYLWNPDRKEFALSGFEVLRVKANPNRYGLVHRRP